MKILELGSDHPLTQLWVGNKKIRDTMTDLVRDVTNIAPLACLSAVSFLTDKFKVLHDVCWDITHTYLILEQQRGNIPIDGDTLTNGIKRENGYGLTIPVDALNEGKLEVWLDEEVQGSEES